jgi:CBS domain-containing protein
MPLMSLGATSGSSESANSNNAASLSDLLITRSQSSLLLSTQYLLSIPQVSKKSNFSIGTQGRNTPPRSAMNQINISPTTDTSGIIVQSVYESEPLLKWKDFDHKCPSAETLSSNFKDLSDRSRYVDLRPYMNPTPFTINALAPLNRAFKLFRHQGLRHLVVINDAHDVVGVISRSDLIHSKLEKILSRTTRTKRWNASPWFTTALDD